MNDFSSTNRGSRESVPDLVEDSPAGAGALKTFHAKTVQSFSDCEIPVSTEFRPIQSLSEHEEYQSSSEIEKLLDNLNKSDNNLNANHKVNTKKKRRRKKKNSSTDLKTEHERETVCEPEDFASVHECDISETVQKKRDSLEVGIVIKLSLVRLLSLEVQIQASQKFRKIQTYQIFVTFPPNTHRFSSNLKRILQIHKISLELNIVQIFFH